MAPCTSSVPTTCHVDDDGFTERAGVNWPSWRPTNWVSNENHYEETSFGASLGEPDVWSAFLHQYIALPGALRKGEQIWWRTIGKIKIGDGAIVIKGAQLIPCVFVDTGPGDKIGEMSLAAHAKFRDPSTLFYARPAKAKSSGASSPKNRKETPADRVSVTTNEGTPGPFIALVFQVHRLGGGIRSCFKIPSPLFAKLTGKPFPQISDDSLR